MVIFGGLEIVAGGYLIHRHYKHKNEKKRQEAEAETRRHNTFPGAKSPACQNHAQHRPPPYQQPPPLAQQKYGCYGPAVVPRPQPQHQNTYPAPQQYQPRPHGLVHAQSFSIPRRPVPQREPDVKPQIIIQPSLQRTDSFATLSRMPIADGQRPQGLIEPSPIQSPLYHATGLQPATQHGVFGNAGFSVSTPALGATPTSPSLTYTMATGEQGLGRHTVDDNWERYEYSGNGRPHYAPTVSTQLGERDPPPPYMP